MKSPPGFPADNCNRDLSNGRQGAKQLAKSALFSYLYGTGTKVKVNVPYHIIQARYDQNQMRHQFLITAATTGMCLVFLVFKQSCRSVCFLCLVDPDPDPLVRGRDPDQAPSTVSSSKIVKEVLIPTGL